MYSFLIITVLHQIGETQELFIIILFAIFGTKCRTLLNKCSIIELAPRQSLVREGREVRVCEGCFTMKVIKAKIQMYD